LSFQQIHKPTTETKKIDNISRNNHFSDKDSSKYRNYNQSEYSNYDGINFNFSNISSFDINKVIQRKPIYISGGGCLSYKADEKSTNIVNIQTKLKVSQPDDPLEREADEVSEQIVAMNYTDSDTKFGNKNKGIATINRKCSTCEEDNDDKEKPIQTSWKSNTNNKQNEKVSYEIFNEIKNVISDRGQPLDTPTKEFMGSRFGYDFSNIRIHTDERAAKSAYSVNALSYTVGNNVIFNEGQYQPNKLEGRRLLAHELTHVVQHSSKVGGSTIGLRRNKTSVKMVSKVNGIGSEPGPHLLADQPTQIIQGAASSAVVQRQPAGSTKQKAAAKKAEPEYDIERGRVYRKGEFYLVFSVTQFEHEVLSLIFVDGKLPPGFKLEGDSGASFTHRWKLTVPPDLSLPYSQLNPRFVNRVFDLNIAPLTLTTEETKSYREREKEHLDTFLPFLGMTAREALDTYEAPSWGEVGGYFIYVGWDGTRKSIFTRPVSKTNEIYNSDMRHYLREGLTPYQAENLFQGRWDRHFSAIMNALAVVTGSIGTMKREPVMFGYQKTGVRGKPVNPGQIGRQLGEKLKGRKGSFYEIAEHLSSKRMTQGGAVIAAEEATKAMGLRLTKVEMPDGNIIVSSVNAGAKQPILVVSPKGTVTYATGTIIINKSAKDPAKMVEIKDILPK
jgi:hypothetical protein